MAKVKYWQSKNVHCLKSYFNLGFLICLTSYTNYTCWLLDIFLNFWSKLIFPWADFFFVTSFGKLSASWFSTIFLHGKTRWEILGWLWDSDLFFFFLVRVSTFWTRYFFELLVQTNFPLRGFFFWDQFWKAQRQLILKNISSWAKFAKLVEKY